jgi:hypothetical protein
VTTYRFYKCGCEPDFDTYCKEADKRVWEARDAMNSWAFDDWMAAEENDRLEQKISAADRWVAEHFKLQNEAGAYTDVEAKDLEPPDDGYDEDPRIVGYPS